MSACHLESNQGQDKDKKTEDVAVKHGAAELGILMNPSQT
jgi:hypothetical protein